MTDRADESEKEIQELICGPYSMVRRDISKLFDIFYMNEHIFAEQFGIGGIQHFSLIASNRSYVPNSVYIGFSDFIAGNSFDTFSLSIQSYGLEKVINRFFGQKGSVWSKPSVWDIFKKRVVRDANPIDDELKLIENIVRIIDFPDIPEL